MVKIYFLFDAQLNQPFYVGATISKLEDRLKEHILFAKNINGVDPHHKERREKMLAILNSGNVPKIVLIDEVHKSEARAAERKYYNIITSLGHNLLQSKSAFNYGTNKPKNRQNG